MYRKDTNYMPYLRYQDKYYSPSIMQVYFGSILIDEVVFLEYSVTQDKRPIYGYSSSYPDAISRGQVLVTGTIAINFRRTPFLQTVIDYVKKNKKLTEVPEESLLDVSDEEERAANIVSYYRYAHADIAYPVGYIEGTEEADEFNEKSANINELIRAKQAMVIADPLICYPDYPDVGKRNEFEKLEKEIEELEKELRRQVPADVGDYTTGRIQAFNSPNDRLNAPEFMNSTTTPFGGFYILRNGEVAPFIIQKNIATALQRLSPSDNSCLITQLKEKSVDTFMRGLEHRLMGGPDTKHARIRRVDEHDWVTDDFFETYVDNNTFDIMIFYGDINDPNAESTIKVINDVHFIGETQNIGFDSIPVLQKFSFMARNIDERPLSDILDTTVDSTENMLNEQNAIELGDTKYKDVEWLYGHLEDKPFAFNHYQDYNPIVVKAERLEEVEEVSDVPLKREPYVVLAMPVVDTCNNPGERLGVIDAGVILALIDDGYVTHMKSKEKDGSEKTGEKDVGKKSGGKVSTSEPLPDETEIEIELRLYIHKNCKFDTVPTDVEKAEYDAYFPQSSGSDEGMDFGGSDEESDADVLEYYEDDMYRGWK